jgi:uncharacterized protein YjdB
MKNTILLIGAIVLIAVLPFVLAKDKADVTTVDISSNETQEANATKQTYGACVSEAAKVKNQCYQDAKEAFETCSNNAADSKETKKTCKTTAKDGLKKCKSDFKAAKKECAKTTKLKFFEKMKYAFA